MLSKRNLYRYAAGYAGIPFEQEELRIAMGPHVLMEDGQPLDYDAVAASSYLKVGGCASVVYYYENVLLAAYKLSPVDPCGGLVWGGRENASVCALEGKKGLRRSRRWSCACACEE